MDESERRRFTLRLAPDLEARLFEARKASGKTMNAEIVDALEWRYKKPNPELELAVAMRPLLESLSDEQRRQLIDIVRTMAKGVKKKRR